MKLYLNIFKHIDTARISAQIKGNINCHYIDFHGNQLDIDDIQKIIVEDFENYRINYNKAVFNFTSFVAQLSTINIGEKHIRSFSFNGLPLFWLTNISEKMYDHWLMKIMLLKEILKENNKFFNQYHELVIIIPYQLKGVKQVLESILTTFNFKVSYVIVKNNKSTFFYLSFIKMSLKTVFQFLKMKEPITINTYNAAYLLGNKITTYTADFFFNISQITAVNNDEIAQIPINYWTHKNYKLTYKCSQLFWDIRPSIYALFVIFLQQFKLLLAIGKLNEKIKINCNDLTFPISLIKNELKNVILREHATLIMTYWLNIYKENIATDVKYFYEDEFCSSGKAFSFALKNLKTFGIQHSMIAKNHSQYHILDVEWKSSTHNSVDGLPLPFQFIVWSDYFKNQFLSYNSIPNSFVFSAGNTTYIKQFSETKETHYNSSNYSILYCLGTLEIFNKEKNIIKNSLNKIPHLKLIVRFHPLWKFDSKLIIDFFNEIEVSFSSEKSIFNELKFSNLVLAGSHSGVWLDCIIAQKPVIRLISSFHDDIESTNTLFNVSSEKDMESAIQLILKLKNKSTKTNLLYLESDRWENLMSTN